MGTIFLILKIILLILLAIVALLLIIIAIILFSPIKYKIEAKKDKEIEVITKATWIFGIFRFYYSKDGNESKTVVKVLFFTIIGKEKKEKNNDDSYKDDNITNEIKKDEIEKDEKNETKDKLDSELALRELKKNENSDYTINTEKYEKIARDKENKKKIKSWEEKLEDFIKKINEFKEKITFVVNYPNKKEIFNYTVTLLKKLAIALKPAKLDICAEIGFSDPAKTAYVIGVTCFLKALMFIEADINGNFKKETIKFEVFAKGKIFFWRIVYPLIRYILKKPIWTIIIEFLKRRDDDNEY